MEENRLSSNSSGGELLGFQDNFFFSSSDYRNISLNKSKRVLRKSLQIKRYNLTRFEVESKSKNISNFICRSKIYLSSSSIALYSPIKNEVMTKFVFDNSKLHSKDVYFPKVNGSCLDFYRVSDLEELSRGKYGILEPNILSAKKIDISDIDLILIPGLAFDLYGNRLGYGGGFYDRSIYKLPSNKVYGLAYDFQILDFIPHNYLDIKMGFLATEKGLIECKGGINYV